MINFTQHTMVKREWGYEIPTTFTDSESGKTYERILLFREKPTNADIEKMADFWIDKINTPEQVYDEMISKEEIINLLVDKNYLTIGETLDDLKSKNDLLKT